MKRTLFIIFFLILNISFALCRDSIPSGLTDNAVPFHSFKYNVILDGFVNDSVPVKAMLDLGAWGLAVPERFRTDRDSIRKYEEISFTVGQWKKRLPATFMNDDSQFLRWYGGECVLLGWDFFDRRILEISYENNYIKVLKPKDLNSLRGYSRLDMEERGKRLLIPASVIIQGQNIEGKYWIDTGLNGTLFFTNDIPSKYGLDLSKTKGGRAKNLDSNRTKVNLIKADTIRIGDSFIVDKDVIFSESEWFVFKENDLYVGLIGNQFFRYFSVIFDFRKNHLYLKPLEE